MRHPQPRNFWWLLLGLIGVSGTAWLINTYAPGQPVHLVVFFVAVFVSCFFLFLFLLNNVRRSTLVSLGVVLYLILRYLNLRQSYYIVLLIASLASLEIALRKR